LSKNKEVGVQGVGKDNTVGYINLGKDHDNLWNTK